MNSGVLYSDSSSLCRTTKRLWKKPERRDLPEYVVNEKKGNCEIVPIVIVHDEKIVRKGKRKPKKETKLKRKLHDVREEYTTVSSEVPRETILDESVYNFLNTLKGYQDRNWKLDQAKGHQKRRFVCGAHETLKHLKADNVKCVFIAKNIDIELYDDRVTDLFLNLEKDCHLRNVRHVRCLSKKQMSKAVNKFPYTNVIGIINFQGAETLFATVTEYMRLAAINDHEHQTSLFA